MADTQSSSGTSSTQPISLSQTFSIPSTVKDSMDQETITDVVSDLCTMLKKRTEPASTTRRKLGSISSPTSPVVLFSEPDQLLRIPTRRSAKLAELLVQQNALSMKSRVRIALMLAWGVLQISSTGWLSGKWTKDNILIVTDTPHNSLPYVSHRFQSSRRASQSSTLDPEATNHIADWIRNASLFALGVFLLEMCYNRSIEDLAVAEEKTERGEPTSHTQFLTATRLARVVQDEMGLLYSQAVNACLYPPEVEMDVNGDPKNPDQFARSILRNIIEPLKTCTDSVFGR